MPESGRYAIAVIGGAVAGAEAARIFAESGVVTVVFEQNARPYGKIEDGLPRWHTALREKERAAIDRKLAAPGVHFVPRTKLGRDVDLAEIANDWGFHAVVLANGAWRDRPLPVPGADTYRGRGLLYQNPLVHWFNHYPAPTYSGPRYTIPDGAIIVGGGLASIDVAKIVQLELTLGALRERGIEVDLTELELAGIPETLEKHNLAWDGLGLEGSTLYYRRRAGNMPLAELPPGADEKTRRRIARTRERIMKKAMDKYLFRFEPLHAPAELLVEGDGLVGLRFARTRLEADQVILTDECVDVRAPLVISSIGSIPEPLAGIELRGDLYAFEDRELGRLARYPTLFSVGNVVTGKGNIIASRRHASTVARYVTEHHLALTEPQQKLAPLSAAGLAGLLERVRARQRAVGYPGEYADWLRSATPPQGV